MFNRNSGSNEHDILQNQFTSYLSFAVSNARIDFTAIHRRFTANAIYRGKIAPKGSSYPEKYSPTRLKKEPPQHSFACGKRCVR